VNLVPTDERLAHLLSLTLASRSSHDGRAFIAATSPGRNQDDIAHERHQRTFPITGPHHWLHARQSRPVIRGAHWRLVERKPGELRRLDAASKAQTAPSE
jgi:hypothetical protein